ncbi:SRPBCC family protein [Flavobacterium sp. 3HN19-14]|uniref:SRPBCC family protein n=1 Tax=Flavobacterium sp. 3HN19-14 TaxID=3448133 RepID=UPI003EE36892
METDKTKITINATVNAPVGKVWESWTKPQHITKWCNASDDWHAPNAENDLRAGGRFTTRMEAKDGSMGFDFGGTYDEVRQNEYIAYTMDDGRTVTIDFKVEDDAVAITETFEAENQNPIEMQRGGWQNILDNFKKYTESIA